MLTGPQELSSAPRMWGSPPQLLAPPPRERIRPTYVGITPAHSGPAPYQPYPPHVCGDHPYNLLGGSGGVASAPRMWGSPLSMDHLATIVAIRPTYVGITPDQPHRIGRTLKIRPTYVGITPVVHCASYPRSDSPHVCGDHPRAVARPTSCCESAPRMWGSPQVDLIGLPQLCIRPTYVGITPCARTANTRPPNPPHAGGDHPQQ